ncbi:MAG: 30S ribosomal protein S20 [Candidatus Omnitrophota bacterium]|nr:30S ribosomal protein S20 [Candidatus Omnitrophota bacterium]MDZ4242170.1 30S ribosomal protein S20 [Candidatus Omnitrophota bacterium]
MPQRSSAKKELRKNRTRHLHNLDLKTDLKKAVKKFMVSVGNKGQDAPANLRVVFKKLDKAAKENILHKNTAARRKSKFARILASAAK